MSNYETIDLKLDGSVALLTLNRPDAANSLNLVMGRELMDAAIGLSQDRAVRAVLLTGSGRLFCAGGDLSGFADNRGREGAYVKELTACLHAAISHFARMRAPLVVAVNGTAAGAGFSLAASGDLVLAAESAKFTMAYTAAALVPDGSSSWYLPRIIGMRRCQELMLTNRRLSAAEACDWGIVTRVVADDALAEQAMNLVRQLAQGPTDTFGEVKRLLVDSLQTGLETQMEYESAAIARAAESEDGREGVSAFLGKRKPVYSGS